MTKVGAYSILRLETLLFGSSAGALAGMLNHWLLPLALLTLLVGMLGALAASALRQQIAYLVVASVGSLLTAFALGNSDGIAAGLYYLPHATFAAGAFFLLADSIALRRGEMGDRFEAAGQLTDGRLLGGLFFIVAVLVGGLPPLSGFVGKWLTLQASITHPWMPWIMAVVLLGSLLSIIALARAGSVLFYRAELMRASPNRMAAVGLEVLPVVALLLLCSALVLRGAAVEDYTRATATQLLQPTIYIDAVLGSDRTMPTELTLSTEGALQP
jgi:multicomponent K+:H+ antiporter subunit D